MKILLLLPALSIGMLSHNDPITPVEKKIIPPHHLSLIDDHPTTLDISTQMDDGSSRMPAAVFKSQQYCRVELKDFEFDTHFSVLSATVYFSGANFRDMAVGTITSNSLKPIKDLMARCVPGSVIIFDDVKVLAPDNTIRSIPGATIMLY